MVVPEIVKETGISKRYWEQYEYRCGNFKKSFAEVAEGFRDRPIKKYEEVFPLSEYGDTITDKNRIRVEGLNNLADFVNRHFVKDDDFTEDDFKILINLAHYLIFGRGYYEVYREGSGHSSSAPKRFRGLVMYQSPTPGRFP